MHPRTIVKTVLAAVVLAGMAAVPAAAEYPEKPIRVIVPTQQGGSTDVMARLFQEAIQRLNLLPQPLVVANVTGAGGTVGTRQIKDSDPDGYTIGVWHTGLVTSRAMGVTEYDHDGFEVIAQTGSIPLGLAVREGGPIQTIEQLVEEARAKPDEVRIATNIGLTVHFVPLVFQEEAGIELRYVQTGGGSRRLQSVLGDHTAVAIFSSQEFISYSPSGLKPIVLFAEERHPKLPDLPTAKEKGYGVIWDEAFLWLAPKGTPQEVIDTLAGALEQAFADPQVQASFEEQAMNADFQGGADTTAMLDALRVRAAEVAAGIGAELEADTLPE
jgi:putative tricarboxylic transport membrane protein